MVRVRGGLDKLDTLITILAPRRWGEERNAETPYPGSRGRARPRLSRNVRTAATDRGLRPPRDLQRDQHLAHVRVPRDHGPPRRPGRFDRPAHRSDAHTSDLQSLSRRP